MSSLMKTELADIIHLEQSAPLSWYDWWNYWSVFIGISIAVSMFLLLTTAFYSIRSNDVMLTSSSKQQMIQYDPQNQDVDSMVNELLYQKRLTL